MGNDLLKEDTFLDESLEKDIYPFLLPYAAAKGILGLGTVRNVYRTLFIS